MEKNSLIRATIDEWENLQEDQKNKFFQNEHVLNEVIKKNLNETGYWRYDLLKSIQQHSLDSLIKLCLDISKMLGHLLPQTLENKVITLIRDEGNDYSSPTTRGHKTNSHLPYHCDRSDVTILLYVRPAEQGGEFSVVSFSEALTQMKEENPELVEILFNDYPFDLREDRLYQFPKWYLRPICWKSANGLRGHYIRRFISDSQRHENCPPLTKIQEEALNLFDQVLENIGKKRQFLPKAGEIVITDNFKVMHARAAFKDPNEKSQRLALRSWIAPFDSIELPRFMLPLTGSVTAGSYRGGVGGSQQHIENLGSINII
jgi:hypothetical protein